MKRSNLCMGLILTAAILTLTSRTFGDSKTRRNVSGSGRSPAGFQNGSTSASLSNQKRSLSRNPWNPKHVHEESAQRKSGGIKLNNGNFSLQDSVIKAQRSVQVPNGGNSNGMTNALTSNPQRGISHMIQLPDGKKVPAVGINVSRILTHNGIASPGRSQIQSLAATAPKHLCKHPKFAWWVNVCHHHCHTNYGCWNVSPKYWECWTTCNWNVVQCQHLRYFVGLNATHIPDMQAYGVQSLVAGSPAQLSGLLPGDLILSVNGQTVSDPNQINAELVRGRLDMQVIREGFATPIHLTVFPRLLHSIAF